MEILIDQDQLEKEKAEQIVASTNLIDGVETVTVELGQDHSGDPALWLVFHLRRGLHPDDAWFDSFNAYASQLGFLIIDSGLTRFPYTKLRPAA